ncbi:MAG: NAD(P)/FAD-dependent oxidoreductase [Clostridia bacterium]|nr:NAD(P)/FAD-dependent oxidoreductase [Clostridia bacterium]
MKRILIAGAGHGGLSAAAHLASIGYNVAVYEKQKRQHLGHDWHDTMTNKTFEYAGIEVYDERDIELRKNSTFFSPALRTSISFDIPDSEQEWEIDRKVLYKYLLDNAVKNGAKIYFEKEVQRPLIKDGKVCGLVVGGEEIQGDLVIDSAGLYSPVMRSLPESYSMAPSYGKNDIFHTFRAYFKLIEGAEITNPKRFNIYFKFNGLKGIAWFKITDGMADVLIGSVEPLKMEQVNDALAKLRLAQPSIGTELLRGGQIKDIPLKSTLSKLVGDNYAALGDVVSMPVPLNGSGITNAVRAGQMLAETLAEIDGRDEEYSEINLWAYQVKYFSEAAPKMISICIIKDRLLKYRPNAIDFLFDKKILTAKELSDGANGREVAMSKADILDKVKKGSSRIIILLQLKSAVAKAKKAKLCALAIPKTYEQAQVNAWRRKIEAFINT